MANYLLAVITNSEIEHTQNILRINFRGPSYDMTFLALFESAIKLSELLRQQKCLPVINEIPVLISRLYNWRRSSARLGRST